jgi:hypothetical protein
MRVNIRPSTVWTVAPAIPSLLKNEEVLSLKALLREGKTIAPTLF